MKILELDNVSFSYKTYRDDALNQVLYIPAVIDVSFSVEEGEFIALIGHNGSGKSTLAKLFNGLFIPRNGEVKVLDMPTNNSKNHFNIRKNIGLVFQNPDNQMVATIVEDDIAFGPENIGVESKEISGRVDFALSSVGMEDYRKTASYRLSGGQKQRLAIAGVLALNPKILVLDEATAMLDPKGRNEVISVIKKLNKEQKMTVILITHFMEEAAEADRILIMHQGKLVEQGTPYEVFSNYEYLKSIGLNLPSAAKVSHFLHENGVDLKKEIINAEELVDAIMNYKKAY